MRKLLFITALLLALPLIGQAQEAPRVEIFGGYSYLRTDNNNNAGLTGVATDQDLHGFNTSFTANLNTWFGVTAEVSGHYGNYNVIGLNVDQDMYVVTVGPRFALRRYERITPFAHALVGVARTSLDAGSITTSTGTISTSINDSGFALVVGGGLDININELVAFRLFQADYVLTRFNSNTQNNFRASTGIVLKLGSQ